MHLDDLASKGAELIYGYEEVRVYRRHGAGRFEVRWGRCAFYKCEAAQLAEDAWYYLRDDPAVVPVAIGISDIDFVEMNFGVSLVDQFSCPLITGNS